MGPDGNVTLYVSALQNTGGDAVEVTDVALSRGTGAAVTGWFFWTTSSDSTPGAGLTWQPPAGLGARFKTGSTKEFEIRLHRAGAGAGAGAGRTHISALKVTYQQHEQPGSLTVPVDIAAVPEGQSCTYADLKGA